MPAVGDTVWLEGEGYPRGTRRLTDVTITGETARSWVVSWGWREVARVPKTHDLATRFVKVTRGFPTILWFDRGAFEADVARLAWIRANYRNIINAVDRCTDVAKLREVARILEVEVTP